MGTRELLIEEVKRQPDALVMELWRYLMHLKQAAKASDSPASSNAGTRKFGWLPGPVRMAEDFDAPLDDFADYRS